MLRHIMDEHKPEYDMLSDAQRDEVESKIDSLIRRGCGCGVLKL
jgi:hypothetical protein